MSKKRWPSDAVIIVAANEGEERRAEMESVVPAECRECGQKLAACSRTIKVAEGLNTRFGRPLAYLCWHCAHEVYDPNTITELHDHRAAPTF